MTATDDALPDLTPQLLLRAYAAGIFPMAESADDPALFWVEPERRGILPLDRFHIGARLARTVRTSALRITIDTAFADVIDGCAAAYPGRPSTWINTRIRTLYGALHEMGHAHSVEVWQGEDLVGGLYGVDLAGAFFGESMFHRARDASKIALVHLVARLIAGGYRLLDAQFITDHLTQFGAIEIPRAKYRKMLDGALDHDADFRALGENLSGAEALAIIAAYQTN